MKKFAVILLSASLLHFVGFGQAVSFHSFKVETITGETLDLASLKGKKVLVVNVASKCGLYASVCSITGAL